MREARLSEQNQYLKFLPLTSPSRESSIPSISDPNSICTVELQVDSVNDTRVDIPIVGRLDLNTQEGYACARFGRPTKIRFSWDPSLSSDVIYVGYENIPLVSETDMASIPALPESFHDCLQYRSAALVMETILGREPGKVLIDTTERIEEQWSDWCGRDAEERPTQKPGFGSLDYDDPMEAY